MWQHWYIRQIIAFCHGTLEAEKRSNNEKIKNNRKKIWSKEKKYKKIQKYFLVAFLVKTWDIFLD